MYSVHRPTSTRFITAPIQPKGALGRSPDKTYAGCNFNCSPLGEQGRSHAGVAGAEPRPGEAGASPDFQREFTKACWGVPNISSD